MTQTRIHVGEQPTEHARTHAHIRAAQQPDPTLHSRDVRRPDSRIASLCPALRMDWHDARVFMVLTAVGLAVVLPALVRDGFESMASIDLAAAAITLATVFLATRRAAADPLRLHLLSGWLATRGVLYVLISTPLLAVVAGFFLGLLTYPLASYGVLLGAALLPLWVSHRVRHSSDPDEPVNQLTTYARNALVPVVIFTTARIPMFYLFGIPYWHPWYAFGNAFTSLPVDQFGTLAAGAVLYCLQGFALATGFYILFRQHSLLNAVLYLAVWDVGLYSYVFPLTRLGMDTPFVWHANSVYAHLCMAAALWGMPYVWSNIWPRLTGYARTAGWSALVVVVVLPFGFAAYQAAAWQFPLQRALDQAIFDRQSLISVAGGPQLAIDGQEARSTYQFRFGPRLYRTWAGATRPLEADELHITGRLVRNGSVIGWCTNDVSRFDGPPQGRDPVAYRNALKDFEYTPIQVTCVGPAAAYTGTERPLLVWQASVELLGDREHARRSFGKGGDTSF